MQNGKAALSIINYNYKKRPTQKNILELLTCIFQKGGKNTKLSTSLFFPLLANLKQPDRNMKGLGKFILNKKIVSKTNPKLSCIYCGGSGATEVTSYIFPFITTIEKYPNIYSLGNKKKSSLNFCPKCMLISFAAQSRWLFRANTPTRNKDLVSAVMFFSDSDDTLQKFYTRFIDPTLLPNNFSNMKNLFKPRQKGQDDEKKEGFFIPAWYSEELIAIFVDYLSKKINELKIIKQNLGAILFSYNNAYTSINKTTIYDTFDIIDDLFPFIRSFDELRKITKRDDAFQILFYSLKKSQFSSDAGDFVFRKNFFRTLFIYRQFNWRAIQDLVLIKASENKRIPYIKSFIKVTSKELLLSSEEDIFSKSSGVGYIVGKLLREKNNNNPNRSKKFIFHLRRCRKPSEVLLLLNLLQAQVETPLHLNWFLSNNNEYFETAKTGLLIGLSNALFEPVDKITK